MMWALEYDPDLFSEYEDPDSANEGSSKEKAKIRHCGKYERENMKAKDAEAPLPIAVFLVASVLKDRSSKLLTEAQGLDDVVKNVGGHYETWNTGVLGLVALRGLDKGKWNLSWAKWTYQVGLKGEIMNLVSPDGISSVDWMQGSLIAQKQQPLTWHKAYFNAPDGDEPLALDMGSMGKGQVWINGQSIGRYWTAFATGNCNGCSYSGYISTSKMSAWLWPTDSATVPCSPVLVEANVEPAATFQGTWRGSHKNWHIESYGKTERQKRFTNQKFTCDVVQANPFLPLNLQALELLWALVGASSKELAMLLPHIPS